jgi:hypothetical protein
VTGENVVAEVATLERAPDNIGDVEDADEAIVSMPANKKCCIFRSRHSFQVRSKMFRRGWRQGPRAVKVATLLNRGKELALVRRLKWPKINRLPHFRC